MVEEGGSEESHGREIVAVKARRALVGAGARILFYPTLMYNVFRNKIQAEFRWWDEVDQVSLAPRSPCGSFSFLGFFFCFFVCVFGGMGVNYV